MNQWACFRGAHRPIRFGSEEVQFTFLNYQSRSIFLYDLENQFFNALHFWKPFTFTPGGFDGGFAKLKVQRAKSD
jgi:hypothetical protein